MLNWSPERVYRAITLFEAEGRSYPEIATELDITITEVRRCISIGRVERSTQRATERRRALPARTPPTPKPLLDRAIPMRRKPEHVPDEPKMSPDTFDALTETPGRRCLYPIDNTRGQFMTCCGASVADPLAVVGAARSYCGFHLKLATGPGTASERAALRKIGKEVA